MSAPLRLALIGAALAALAGSLFILGGGGRTPPPTPTASPFTSVPPLSSVTPSVAPRTLVPTTGSLAPGAYTARMAAGRLELTVPTGWSSPTVTQLSLAFQRAAGPTDDTVQVFFDMRRAAKDARCTEWPEPGVGSAADAIATDLAGDANLAVTRGGPVSATGMTGEIIDVALAAGAKRTCPFSAGQPSVPLIVDTIPGEGAFWGVGPNERIRLVVLDADGGHNIVVAIDSADGSSFDDLVAATMPIVQSLGFTAAGPLAACTDPTYPCAGSLAAGTVSSMLFQPGFTFTVPSGWSSSLDRARSYYLVPPGHAFDMQVTSQVAIPDQTANCGASRKPSAGTSVADWVTFLTTHPGLTATAPVDVTIGGYPGKSVSFHRSDTWTKTCPNSIGPAVVVMTDTGNPPTRSTWIDDHHVTFTIVDVKGTTVIVGIYAGPTEDNLAGANANAKAVLDSIRFGGG
jgi:hypothetical protein